LHPGSYLGGGDNARNEEKRPNVRSRGVVKGCQAIRTSTNWFQLEKEKEEAGNAWGRGGHRRRVENTRGKSCLKGDRVGGEVKEGKRTERRKELIQF